MLNVTFYGINFFFLKRYILVDIFASVKLLCGLEASQGPVQEVLSAADVVKDVNDNSEELDSEEGDGESRGSRKKKNKRRKGNSAFITLPLANLQFTNINMAYSAAKKVNDR